MRGRTEFVMIRDLQPDWFNCNGNHLPNLPRHNNPMGPTEVRPSQTGTVQETSETERKAKADVEETRGDETPKKGRDEKKGFRIQNAPVQFCESPQSRPPSSESQLALQAVDISRWRLENVRLSCPADGIKRGFGSASCVTP